jgi:hypothetical protein
MTQQRNWHDKAVDLVRAVSDLAVPAHPGPGRKGTPPHRKLFKAYVAELAEAAESANAWWHALIEEEEERTDSYDEAVEYVRERHPGGPAAHKFVIAAVRKAWLACDALNKRSQEVDRVQPEELVLAWLVRDGHQKLGEFISQLTYWPVGLDEDGAWV